MTQPGLLGLPEFLRASQAMVAPTSRPGRSAPNDARYAEIVSVAAVLFARQGYDGTSLMDIAVEVGVLKGSLYHYITSKENLLFDVIKLCHQGIYENLLLCQHFTSAPLDELIAFCYGHIVLNATEERFARGAVYLTEGDKLSKERRDEVKESRDYYESYLRDILSRGQKAKVIDQDLDLRLCSFAILGTVTSYLRWFDPRGPMSPQTLGREFAAFSVAAVREHPPRGSVERWADVDDVIRRCNEVLGGN